MSIEAHQGSSGDHAADVLEAVPEEARSEAADARQRREPTPMDVTCPSCDARGEWSLSARHRYSPFGAVLLLVLAFWTGVVGWLFGLGYWVPVVLLLGALFVGLARRTAWVCESCGYVRPRKGA